MAVLVSAHGAGATLLQNQLVVSGTEWSASLAASKAAGGQSNHAVLYRTAATPDAADSLPKVRNVCISLRLPLLVASVPLLHRFCTHHCNFRDCAGVFGLKLDSLHYDRVLLHHQIAGQLQV